MIYILTGIIVFIAVYQYKRHLLKTLRIIGYAYLAIAIIEGVTGGRMMPLFISGLGAYDGIIHLVIGVALIVFGTKEIRMPSDDIAEDDLHDEEYNPLTH